jgi:hypothetical protein
MLIIGEVLDCTRKKVGAAAAARDVEFFKEIARRQVDAGADMLDVNGGLPGQELEVLPWLVNIVQERRYAPTDTDGDTTFDTDSWLLSAREPVVKDPQGKDVEDFLMDGRMEAGDQPPCYPVMESAKLNIQTLDRLLGRASGRTTAQTPMSPLPRSMPSKKSSREVLLPWHDGARFGSRRGTHVRGVRRSLRAVGGHPQQRSKLTSARILGKLVSWRVLCQMEVQSDRRAVRCIK